MKITVLGAILIVAAVAAGLYLVFVLIENETERETSRNPGPLPDQNLDSENWIS
jgi:hypothetical protein